MDVDADCVSCVAHGASDFADVAVCGLGIAVAEQVSDDMGIEIGGCGLCNYASSQIMNPDVVKLRMFGAFAEESAERRVGHLAMYGWKYVWFGVEFAERLKDVHGWRWEIVLPAAGLGVGEHQATGAEVDVVPVNGENLADAETGESGDSKSRDLDRMSVFVETVGGAEAVELVSGEGAVAGRFAGIVKTVTRV